MAAFNPVCLWCTYIHAGKTLRDKKKVNLKKPFLKKDAISYQRMWPFPFLSRDKGCYWDNPLFHCWKLIVERAKSVYSCLLRPMIWRALLSSLLSFETGCHCNPGRSRTLHVKPPMVHALIPAPQGTWSLQTLFLGRRLIWLETWVTSNLWWFWLPCFPAQSFTIIFLHFPKCRGYRRVLQFLFDT